MNVIKGLFGSKKFWVATVGGAVIAGMKAAGLSEEMIAHITTIIGVLLGAMGLTDFSKGAQPAK